MDEEDGWAPALIYKQQSNMFSGSTTYTLFFLFLNINMSLYFLFTSELQWRDWGLHAASLYGKDRDAVERHLFIELRVKVNRKLIDCTGPSLVVRSFLPTALFLTTVLELLNLVYPGRGCWELLTGSDWNVQQTHAHYTRRHASKT